jgi:hypothetical protein
VLRFLKALLPHLALTVVGVLGGAITGLVFDFEILKDGGLGPAAAHAGAIVLFLLAAVPVLLALVGGYVGLLFSLLLTILWDGVRSRWRRRTLVRIVVLLGGAYPWLSLVRSAPPEGGWTILHYVAVLLLSLTLACAGLVAGLLLAKFLMSSEPRGVGVREP